MSSRVKNILKMKGIAVLPFGFEWYFEGWGTKWNAMSFAEVSSDKLSFETEWSYPEGIVKKISEMCPDKSVEITWADEHCGTNAGRAVYINGELIEGGRHEDYSQEAYQTFVDCWGEQDYLKKDKNGIWRMIGILETNDIYSIFRKITSFLKENNIEIVGGEE